MSSLLEAEPVQKEEVKDSQMVADGDFVFQQAFAIHQGSVRCLAILKGTNSFVSGSIDKSVKLHLPSAVEKGKYEYEREFSYHESFVYALTPEVMANGFFSGGKDNKIYHVDAAGNPARIFTGHDGPVSSLCQAVPEELVSGSWDGTARIWDTATGSCKKVLEAGAHAVTVLALPNGVIITGS